MINIAVKIMLIFIVSACSIPIIIILTKFSLGQSHDVRVHVPGAFPGNFKA